MDWFMVSAGLANGAESKVGSDAAMAKHKPVRLKIGGKLNDDMGMRLRRPIAFQGMIRKEAKENHDEAWKQWNEPSENFLGMVENKNETNHKGKRKDISFVRNLISAPQDNSEGFAITQEVTQNQVMLN
eukprot:13994376-Heterocapsa_arctica.AAC.1